MVIKWTKPAQLDLNNYFKFTKTLHPEEYIYNLIDYIDMLKLFPDLGKDYIEIDNIKNKNFNLQNAQNFLLYKR